MGKKAPKSSRKFVASGQLKKTIQARKKHQEIKRKFAGKRSKQDAKGKRPTSPTQGSNNDARNDEESIQQAYKGKGKIQSVDDFLGGAFTDDEPGDIQNFSEDQSEDDHDEMSDGGSFASVDELEDEGQAHLNELSLLAAKDPEFYQYLLENDRDLLDFDANVVDEDLVEDPNLNDGNDQQAKEQAQAHPLTLDILRKWQKALLEQHSLRALRQLLIAFRAAAYINEEEQNFAWTIEDTEVYDKLLITALRYTPVVLEHHVPYKTLVNGRFKLPSQSKKQRTLSKLVLSFFHNIIHVIAQISDPPKLQLALSSSARLLPYVLTSRKAVKSYLKTCLELWSTAEDEVRVSSILAIRRMASSADVSMLDSVLKGTYMTLVRSTKNTTVHSLPSINLMKNSAAEIYCMDHATAYQHAFGYIRQLAMHLRNSMKVKTKDAFKQVYNWQYAHSVDFWSLVLSEACDMKSQVTGTQESELKALIYPLVQVALGAIKLIPAARSYPFHLHIMESLLRLTRRTRTYIPLSPHLLPILLTSLSPNYARSKPSTLKPLDFETSIRAPQQYLKTRIYGETLAEEASYLLAEWFASRSVQGSIAFPELTVPILVVLRKSLKNSRNAPKSRGGKEIGIIKGLIDRVEETARWIDQKRKSVTFGPAQPEQVAAWELDLKIEESPLTRYLNVQRKAREKRKLLIEKARKGEEEMLED